MKTRINTNTNYNYEEGRSRLTKEESMLAISIFINFYTIHHVINYDDMNKYQCLLLPNSVIRYTNMINKIPRPAKT